MRTLAITVSVALALVSATADAAPLSFIPAEGSGSDAGQTMYSWRVTSAGASTISGAAATGASLFADRAFSRNTSPDKLFVHLLDTARTGGVGRNAFAVAATLLVLPNTTGATAETTTRPLIPGRRMRAFAARPEAYSYDFSRAQVLKLNEYLASGGDVSIALDPDSRLFEEAVPDALVGSGGAPVPEPASLALLTLGLSGLYAHRRRSARTSKS